MTGLSDNERANWRDLSEHELEIGGIEGMPAPVTLDEPAAAKTIRGTIEWLADEAEDERDPSFALADRRREGLAALDALLADRARLADELDEFARLAYEANEGEKKLEARCERAEEALRQIADPLNHHYKPDYVRPEVIARDALAAAGAGEET